MQVQFLIDNRSQRRSFILEGGSDMLSLKVGNGVLFEAAMLFLRGK